MNKIIMVIAMFVNILSYAQTKIENVDATTFKKLIEEKKSILIDLRTDDELKNKGFIKMPFKSITLKKMLNQLF